MLVPKNITTCSNSVQPKQPEVRIERAKASPEQLAAWRRLWRLLLMEPVDNNESPARRDEGEHHDQKR